jgi:hypothetical protein
MLSRRRGLPEKDAGVTDSAHGEENYGVLVGWRHRDSDGRIDLQLETVFNPDALAQHRIDTHHIVLTHQQATILANYLYTITGQTRPGPRRGRLTRWFGR